MKLAYCTYIRIFAMASIVLCHLVPHHPNLYVQSSVQFFNIGVQIFFILSGFLLGQQGEIKFPMHWYKKRLKRIYLPWLLFVAVLAGIHLCKGNSILTFDWLKLVLGLQGANVGVQGAGQTWFITSLIVCYLATPLLNACLTRFKPSAISIALLCLPVALAFLPMNLFTLLCPLCWFGIAYIIGRTFDSLWLTPLNAWIALFIALLGFANRFVAKQIITSHSSAEMYSFLYEKLCVNYSMFLAAIGIMFVLAVILQNKPVRPFGKFLSDISYEVYLYHYMLCVGPISLFALKLSWLPSSLLVIVCAICIASIAHYAIQFSSLNSAVNPDGQPTVNRRSKHRS